MALLKFSEAPVYEPLPTDAEYSGVIVEAEIKPTKDGQSENLNLKIEVNDQPQKYTVFRTFNLKPQSLPYVAAFLNAVYNDEDFVNPDEDMDFDPSDLIGKQVGFTVKDNTNPNNGKVNSQPDVFFPI